MFKKLSPNLMVKDISETVDFYTNNLDFELVMAVPETQDGMDTSLDENKRYVWAQVKSDNVEIMLQEEGSLKKDVTALSDAYIGASVSFYIEVENIEELYNNIKGNVDVVKELETSWYGMNEFYIRDNNGYILGFAEQKETE